MPIPQKNEIVEMERLFKRHYSLLCLTAFSLIKDRDISKDIVQDFFTSYWQRKQKVRLESTFKAYAVGAVKNLSLRWIQKAKKEEAVLQSLPFTKYEEPTNLVLQEKENKLQKLLEQLPEKRRRIFVMKILKGYSYEEISENLGISVNTVKTQMKRAYAFFRSQTTEEAIHLFIWSLQISFVNEMFI